MSKFFYVRIVFKYILLLLFTELQWKNVFDFNKILLLLFFLNFLVVFYYAFIKKLTICNFLLKTWKISSNLSIPFNIILKYIHTNK